MGAALSQRVFPAQTVASFPKVLSSASYTPVPAHSWIALTDVAGSTDAIGKGRYKAVNLAGAAGIAAFANAFPQYDLPAFFGGDGAAILVPGGAQDRAARILSGLQSAAQSVLGLRLRTALVPVEVVRRQGLDVGITYQELPGGRTLAMASGGGISYAEALFKTPEGFGFCLSANSLEIAPNFDGLSCRWQPVAPARGVMLTILVQGPTAPEAYLPVFDAIAAAASGPQSPLTNVPRPAWPPKGLMSEARLRNPRQPLRAAISVLGQSALGALSAYSGMTIGGFNGQKYRDSLARHCDALKFADGLKMVVDCTPAEADTVEAVLDGLPGSPDLVFGLQRSASALMTCFVQSTNDGGHIHFIDGAEGGYALAARQLKGKQPLRA